MKANADNNRKRKLPDIYTDINVEICLGIDEAGRGPVLGPMVYGCAYYPFNQDEALKSKYKFNDSKKLSEEKRDKIFNKMQDTDDLFWDVVIISPKDISNKMLRRSKYNLNIISNDAALELLDRRLKDKVNITKVRHILKYSIQVFVDTVGKPETYKKLFEDRFATNYYGTKIEYKVESKADSTYPVVGAASIAAKVINYPLF